MKGKENGTNLKVKQWNELRGDEVRVHFTEILFFEATESNFQFMSIKLKATIESGNPTMGKVCTSYNKTFHFSLKAFNTLLHTFHVPKSKMNHWGNFRIGILLKKF